MSDVETASTAAQVGAAEVCRLLVGQPGGSVQPGEGTAALNWTRSRWSRALQVGLEAGWLVRPDGPKGRVSLTREGWSRFGREAAQQGAGDALAAATEGWPEVQRAFLRLMVSSMVARWHLGRAQPNGHLTYIAIGPSGTGKSASAALVCDLFGLPRVEHTRQLPALTGGALLGRVSQGGAGEWEYAPPSFASSPFVLLDEFDKADEQLRRRVAMTYALGEVEVSIEDRTQQLRPTVMLAANYPAAGDLHAILRPEVRRRSVVLDTASLRARGHSLESTLRAYYRRTDRPRLSLEALRPPEWLADPGARLLSDAKASAMLTDTGREEFPPVEALEHAALGRLALAGDGMSHLQSALETVSDYFTVTETMPSEVAPDWRDDIRRVAAEIGGAELESFTAAFERGRGQREEAAQGVRRARVERDSATLEIKTAGATLAASCERLREALNGQRLRNLSAADHDEAKGLRRTLAILQDEAGRVSTGRGLEDVRAKAQPYLARAENLVHAEAQGRVEAQQAQAARAQAHAEQKRQAAQQRAEDTRARQQSTAMARMQASSERKARAAALAEIQAAARPLEALWRRTAVKDGEFPWHILRSLRVGREQRPLMVMREPVLQEPTGTLSRLRDWIAPPASEYAVLDLTGRAVDVLTVDALGTWGPGTRRVLAPTLAQLHAMEDKYLSALGRQARKGRPAVSTAEPRLLALRGR